MAVLVASLSVENKVVLAIGFGFVRTSLTHFQSPLIRHISANVLIHAKW